MDLLVFAHVRRHAPTTLVVVFSIALGVAAFLAVGLANRTIVAAFHARENTYGTNVTLQVIGSEDGFDEGVLRRVALVPGVLEARPVIEDTLAVAMSAGPPASRELLRVEGVDTFAALPGDTETREALPGPFAPSADPAPETFVDGRGVVISARVAARYGLRTGRTLVAYAGPRALHFRIASVFPANAGSVDSSTLYMDIATAQPAFGKRGRLDRIDCVTASARTADVRTALATVLPSGLRVVTPQERFADLHRLLAALSSAATALSLAALFAGAGLTYNAVALSVASRRADIGTLRALGAKRRAILATFVIEGAAFGALGALFGLALGTFGAEWAVGQATRAANLETHVEWEPGPILTAFAAGVVCATLSALGPALAAARIAPTQAMNARGFERGAFRAGAIRGGVRRAIGRLPAPAQLAVLHLESFPARIAVAVATLAGAVALLAGVEVTIDSYRTAVEVWTRTVFRADLTVRVVRAAGGASSARFSARTLRRLRTLPGVAALIAERDLDVPFRDGRATVVAILGRRSHDVAPDLQPHQTRLGRALANRFALRVGDSLTFDTPSGPVTLTVAGIADDVTSDSGRLELNAATFARLYRDATFDRLDIDARRDESIVALRTRVVRALAPLPVDVATTRELRERAASTFAGVFSLARALVLTALAIAVAGIASSLVALVLERRDEIALLRYVGMTASGIGWMVLCEAASIASIGTAVGLATGIAATLSIGLIEGRVFGTNVALELPLGELASAAVAILVAALLAGVYPARLAARIEAGGVARAL